jgi:hypothetical protein
VAASGLADVLTGYLQPLEPGGVGKHSLQELAVLGLAPRSLLQCLARIRDPSRQRVAHGLQLTEVEHPRLTGPGRDRCVENRAWERIGDEAGELALEAADLSPQLSPRQALVAGDEKVGGVSLQEVRHHRFRV